MRIKITIFLLCFSCFAGTSQVGINNPTPDQSAALDISSTDKGLLIPRVDTNAVISPAIGLMIFQPSDNGFYFYNGSNWQQLGQVAQLNELSDTDGDTKVMVEKTADEDVIRFQVGGNDKVRFISGANDVVRLEMNELSRNIAIGTSTMDLAQPSSVANIGIGSFSLSNLSSGSVNTAVGFLSQGSNVSGDWNSSFGNKSLLSNVHGSNNTTVGSKSLFSLTSGNSNVAIGDSSGYNNNGSGNVFIGSKAGANHGGSNKLFIDNTDTNEPLIWGDFTNDLLHVRGNLEVFEGSTIHNGLRVNDRLNVNASYAEIAHSIKSPSAGYERITEFISSTGAPQLSIYEIGGVMINGISGFNARFTDIGLAIKNPSSNINKITEAISSTGSAKLTVYEDGRIFVLDSVAIGSNNFAKGYKLNVDGKIMAEEVRVLLSSNWPDYVFKEDYHLPTLPELEKSIKAQGHLPGIPAAKVMEAEGQDLGEINRLQMEKIEELTLYIIDLEKRIQSLETSKNK